MTDTPVREGWEEELYGHARGKGFGARVDEVHARLHGLWQAAQPMGEEHRKIIGYIRTLRQCNWRLEQAVWDLCRAIGSGDTVGLLYGHSHSITDERWRQFWAYYLTLCNWLPKSFDPGGYAALLRVCDPDGGVAKHVLAMLGDRTELKELYVKRFCLWLEWTVLGGMYKWESSRGVVHKATVDAIEARIRDLDPEGDILPWLQEDGDGHTELCHHKAFRRYDIIISSIGAAKWRAAMPERSTAAADLLSMHDRFVHALESWVEGTPPGNATDMDQEVHALLGPPEPAKLFLVAFLAAILSAQRGNLRSRIGGSGVPKE